MYENGFFGSSAKLFVGREEEVARVVEFCTVPKKKLLIVFGLPGIGKSELIRYSISTILKRKHTFNLCNQSFLKLFVNSSLNVECLATMIYEEIHPGIFLKTHSVRRLSELLTKISTPTILILEMSYACFSKDDSEVFWKLIQEVLIPENALKIIIICCTMPNLSISFSVSKELLHLQNLDRRSVISLLNHISPCQSEEHCSSVADYCHGNPFLVWKMGTLVKNLQNHGKDVCGLLANLANSILDHKQILITQTILNHDLEIVFEGLKDIEKTTLTKLLCFNENIPVDEVESVFGLKAKSLVKQFYAEHGLLERSTPGMYHMNGTLQTFLLYRCRANEEYNELLLDSKKQIIRFYTQFLWLLDEVFFLPSKLDEASQVKRKLMNYRSKCKKCEIGNCNCPIPSIMQMILIEVKTSLFCYVKAALDIKSIVNDVIDSCCKAAHFLRKSLSCDTFQALFEMLLNNNQLRNDKLRLVAISSHMVFTKTYHRPQNAKEENIRILKDSIDYLETLPMLSSVLLETLAISYVNRGYLKGFCRSQFKDGILDIEKGRKILTRLTFNGRDEITYLRTRGYLAGKFFVIFKFSIRTAMGN